MDEKPLLPESLLRLKERLKGVASGVPLRSLEDWLATSSTIERSSAPEPEKQKKPQS